MSTVHLGHIKAGVGESGTVKVDDDLQVNGEATFTQQVEFQTPLTVPAVFQSAPQMLHLQHRAFGTGVSGTFTAGSWQRRPINHVVWNTIPGASFSSAEGDETFTLPAGLYWMDLYSCAFYVNANLSRLYNVTDVLDIDYGDLGMSNPKGGYNNSGSTIRRYVELTGTKILAVDHRCQTTRSNDGFGYRGNILGGEPGIYADYRIWKVN